MAAYRRVFNFHFVSFACVCIFTTVCIQYSFCDNGVIGREPKLKINVDPNNDETNKDNIVKSMDQDIKKDIPKVDNKLSNNLVHNPNIGGTGQDHRQLKLADAEECAADVKHYCAKAIHNNNFALLECLQEDVRNGGGEVSAVCQHYLWKYKQDLTTDKRFFSAAKQVCQIDLEQMPDCQGHKSADGCLIPCIIQHQDSVTEKSCRQFLKKMTSVVFDDWQLTKHFVEGCNAEIENFKCGRIDKQEEDEHTQISVLICLEDHIGKITNEVCHKQILRLAELQADDYHLDRPLYFACRDVREVLCDQVKAGNGQIYDCLFKHKFDKRMTEECRSKLVVRQQIVGEDVKADKSFYDACKQDIKIHKCQKHLKDGTDSDFTKMSTILLCLEDALKEDKSLAGNCISEMNEWRRSLMEDYQINPELVSKCETEINKHCKERGPEGEIIHCLLDLARSGHDPEKRKNGIFVTDECQRELEDLLKEADVGEDYRMDPALEHACESVVQELCADITPGDARVLGCLMEKMDDESMVPVCQARLLEIQYFVARDFRLDHELYKACKTDSQKLCHGQNSLGDNDNEVQQAELGPLTIPCLYRNRAQLERSCERELKRVMHIRAKSVQLMPEIEEACMSDLSTYCHDRTGPGEEMNCLQDHFGDVSKLCQNVVANFTAEEEDDLEMDPIMAKFCMPVAKKLCADLFEEEADGEEILDCLIENKNHHLMKRRCFSQVEHYERMMFEDYHLSHQFREACKKSINSLCKGKTKKMDIVLCLSETMRNDSVYDHTHRVEKECRKQMRVDMLSRGKSLDVDPEILTNCANEIEKYCGNITPGQSQLTECLRKKQKKLRGKCYKTIFKIEEIETMDNELDYTLMKACKKMIKTYCENKSPEHFLECLKRHKDEEDFDDDCLKIVTRRQIVQNTDYRLNNELQKACRLDVPKFCKTILQELRDQPDDENQHGFEGKIINCLEKQSINNRLSETCHRHITEIIHDAARDYRQDNVLSVKCAREIKTLCSDALVDVDEDSPEGTGKGKVEDCLKKYFLEKKIKDPDCSKEVARIVLEAKADIHVDPLLNTACERDIHKYCHDVLLGEGKVMTCLLSTDENPSARLTPGCKKNLDERRKMWEYAAKFGFPETMSDLAFQITGSPSRGYFAGAIFTIIGLIFIVGISCGRVTKRITRANKTK